MRVYIRPALNNAGIATFSGGKTSLISNGISISDAKNAKRIPDADFPKYPQFKSAVSTLTSGSAPEHSNRNIKTQAAEQVLLTVINQYSLQPAGPWHIPPVGDLYTLLNREKDSDHFYAALPSQVIKIALKNLQKQGLITEFKGPGSQTFYLVLTAEQRQAPQSDKLKAAEAGLDQAALADIKLYVAALGKTPLVAGKKHAFNFRMISSSLGIGSPDIVLPILAFMVQKGWLQILEKPVGKADNKAHFQLYEIIKTKGLPKPENNIASIMQAISSRRATEKKTNMKNARKHLNLNARPQS